MKETQDPPRSQPALLGSYRPGEVLGYGPAGPTYLAERQDQPEHAFALKTFSAKPLHASQAQEQVLREIQTLQQVRHRSILPVLEAWISEDVLYLVSPYAPGGSLQQILFSASHFPPLPLPETLAIVRQIGEALHAAHGKHVVHANLKPENILFHLDGYALVADFALPTFVQTTRVTDPSSAFAARYMAPEQFREEQPTPATDQYALACVICELLTGLTPHEAQTFEELRVKHLSEPPTLTFSSDQLQMHALIPVLQKALAKKSEERYATVQAFLSALDAVLVPAPVQNVALSDLVMEQTPPASAPLILPTQSAIPPATSSVLSTPSATQAPTPAQSVQPDPAPLVLPAPPTMQAPASSTTSVFPPPMLTHSLVTPSALASGDPSSPLPPRPRARTRKPGWLVAIITSVVMCLMLIGVLLLYPLLTSSGQHAAKAPTPTRTVPTSIARSAGAGSTPAPATSTPVSVGSPTTAGTSTQAASCAVNYKVNAQWPGGFVATITVLNSGITLINGWTLTFTFAENQSITNGWNGTFLQRGTQVSIINASYNTQIAPSSSVNPGFQGTWSSDNPSPISFALNGITCTNK